MRIQTSALVVAFGVLCGTGPHAAPALDYGYFKNKVQPVFLKKRAEHTRCVVCHADANNALKLVQPTAGSNAWTVGPGRTATGRRVYRHDHQRAACLPQTSRGLPGAGRQGTGRAG